jgi:transposase
MSGKSPVSASEDERAALAALAGSRDRGEADRARAILLTLSGWSSPRIAEAFGVREDTVRLWRSDFSRGGTDVLKASVAPGPSPVKSETALRVVTPLLEEPVANRPNWTIARMRAEIEAREGVRISRSQLSKALRKKKFRYRRPRHTLKGRQVANEVDRIGLRLQLREQQAEAGDIVLLYGDESEALTHPYLARAWAKSGADLRVPAPGQAQKVAILGSLNHVTRELTVHTSSTKRSGDFVAHLEQLDALYGPMPGRVAKPVVLVEDNGPIHVSKVSLAALAARAHWLTVEWLPKYTPELNDIEVVWHDLKAYQLAHKTFTGVAELDGAIHTAVKDLNRERMVVPLAKLRISA